jgi:23S rRNA pseudouridine2605 synthase
VSASGPAGERLQKVLAHAGVASRRAAEELIQAGRVAVDGVVVTELGTRVDPARARITVDGEPLRAAQAAGEERVTYLLNKPMGVVSTADDPQGRSTVVDLVPATPRVYPVGRLDADTEGLLLLSNDGDLTYLLTHPRFGVEKEYTALVRGYVTQESLRRLREGVLLAEDERPTAPARVDQISTVQQNTLLRFIIHEGRNRQIRRMMAAVGGSVLSLKRVRFGPLTLGDLRPAEWRRLTPVEVAALRDAAAAAGAPAAEPAPAAAPRRRSHAAPPPGGAPARRAPAPAAPTPGRRPSPVSPRPPAPSRSSHDRPAPARRPGPERPDPQRPAGPPRHRH